MRDNSRLVAAAVTDRTRIMTEGFGTIRDILLDRSQPVFEARFASIEGRQRRAQAVNNFTAVAPRYVLEAAGVVALALVAVLMSREPGGLAAAIPVLGALALGAQRLLPLIQQAWLGWSQLAAHDQMLVDVLALMQLPVELEALPPPGGLPFGEAIVFDQVTYRYPGGREALRDVSLRIERGERVGVCGRTGGGKSTLLDLLMGLIEPVSGEIRVDGERLSGPARAAWQAQVAHVPQSIYLADDTIAANIAFGDPAPDAERIEAAASAARIDALVDSLPERYATIVGERGMRLSGGQRQRIGIARALYKQAAVLVLDEATSALDDATEAEVIRSLTELAPNVTLVMVAHRASTLALCGRTIRLDAGRILAP